MNADDVELPRHQAPSRAFILGLALLLILLAGYLAKPYLGAIVLALLLGFLLHPFYKRTLEIVRYPSIASGIMLLVVALVLVVPALFVIRELTDDVVFIAGLLQDPQALQQFMTAALRPFGVSSEEASRVVTRVGEGVGGALQDRALPTLTAVAHFFASLLIFFILLFFVIRDGDVLFRAVRRITPLPRRHKERLFQLAADRTRAITLGTFLVSILQGLAGGLGWWFFDLPAPIFWGFVMTVIGVLPLGAPFMVLVPGAIFKLAQGELFNGIGLLIYTAVIVGLIDDLARPYLVGRTAGVHPAIILVGTLGGLYVFGVSGFLLGPLLLSLLPPVLQVWADMREEEEGDGEGDPPPILAS